MTEARCGTGACLGQSSRTGVADSDDDDDDDDEVPVSLPELVYNADYREHLARVIDDSVSAVLSPEMHRVRDTDETTWHDPHRTTASPRRRDREERRRLSLKEEPVDDFFS